MFLNWYHASVHGIIRYSIVRPVAAFCAENQEFSPTLRNTICHFLTSDTLTNILTFLWRSWLVGRRPLTRAKETEHWNCTFSWGSERERALQMCNVLLHINDWTIPSLSHARQWTKSARVYLQQTDVQLDERVSYTYIPSTKVCCQHLLSFLPQK